MISQVLSLYEGQQQQVFERLENSFQDQLQRTKEAVLKWQSLNQDLFQEVLSNLEGLDQEQKAQVLERFTKASQQSAKFHVLLIQPALNFTQGLDSQLIQSTDRAFKDFLDFYHLHLAAQQRVSSETLNFEQQKNLDLLALDRAREQAKISREHLIEMENIRHQKEMLKIRGGRND